MSTALPYDVPPVRHLSPVPDPPQTEPGASDAREDPAPPARRALVAVPPLTDESRSEIPDPHPDLVRSLAMAVFEIVEGLRTAAHLGALLTFSALRQLSELGALRRDQLTVLRASPRAAQRVGSVRTSRPSPEIAETATVVYAGARARAVALRLEWIGRRWRVTQVAVL